MAARGMLVEKKTIVAGEGIRETLSSAALGLLPVSIINDFTLAIAYARECGSCGYGDCFGGGQLWIGSRSRMRSSLIGINVIRWLTPDCKTQDSGNNIFLKD